GVFTCGSLRSLTLPARLGISGFFLPFCAINIYDQRRFPSASNGDLVQRGETSMNKGNLSRRGFLARSLAGLVSAGLPVWYAQEVLVDAQEKDKQKTNGPNDRIIMGAIGTGTNRTRRPNADTPLRGERGYHIMQDAMGRPGVQFIAVCDVD